VCFFLKTLYALVTPVIVIIECSRLALWKLDFSLYSLGHLSLRFDLLYPIVFLFTICNANGSALLDFCYVSIYGFNI